MFVEKLSCRISAALIPFRLISSRFIPLGFLTLFSSGFAQADWLYQPEMLYSGDDPHDVKVADLDGDSYPDIVTSHGNNLGLGGVSVRWGEENGVSVDLSTHTVGVTPFGLAVGDVDGDELLDLATANFRSNYLSLLSGLGGGLFADQVLVGLGFSSLNAIDVALADVNKDGLDDLIYSLLSGVVGVAEALVTGGFDEPSLYTAGGQPYDIEVVDLNADGFLDILTADQGAQQISILLGQATATFSDAQSYIVGNQPSGLAVADMNNDDLLDVVVSNEGDDTISLLLGNGLGNLTLALEFEVGDGPVDVALADFNNDGRVDIVTANDQSADVSLLLANTSGGFQAPVSLPVGFNFALKRIAVASLNADEAADILVVHDGQSSSEYSAVGVLLSDNNLAPQPHARYQTGAEPVAPVIADVNGDGLNDVVVANSFSDTLGVYLGQADGTLAAAENYNSLDSRPRSVAVADLNRDGLMDLVSANGRDDSVSVFLALLDGGFAPALTYAVDRGPISVAVADVNRDGLPDILTSNLDAGTVSLLYGLAAGGYQAFVSFNTGSAPRELKLGDLNADGYVDAVVGSQGNTLAVLMGSASGFAAPDSYTVGNNAYEVALGDINKDGLLDIASANSTDTNISLLLAQPSGDYAPAMTYELNVLGDAHDVEISDIDLDGNPDVVVTDSAFGISLFLGDGTGVLGVPRHFTTLSRQGNLAVGDLNQDGRPELLVTDVYQQAIEVLQQQGNGAELVLAVGDSFTVEENQALETTDLLINDIGVGIVLQSFDQNSAQGGLVSELGGNRFRYEPPADFIGVDTFAYRIANSQIASQGTVTINVIAAGSSGGSGNGGGSGGGSAGNPGGGSSSGGGGSLSIPLLGFLVLLVMLAPGLRRSN